MDRLASVLTEYVCRDPWWVFVCLMLLRVIRNSYDITTLDLVRVSPRFGILLASMLLAVIFTILDIIASVHPRWFGSTDGYVRAYRLPHNKN